MQAHANDAKVARDVLLDKCRMAQKKARLRGLPPPRRVKPSKDTTAAAAATALPADPASPVPAVATAAAGKCEEEMTALTANMLKDFRTGELAQKKVKELADLEKDLYETCGGDTATFCRTHGIDDGAVPVIQGSITDMLAGMSLEDSLVNTMKTLSAKRA